MQIPIQDALLQDPQLKGRAQRLMLSRDVYRPARPMKAHEVAKLEKLMMGHLDTIDKYMLGAILFAIFHGPDGQICSIFIACGLTGMSMRVSFLASLKQRPHSTRLQLP